MITVPEAARRSGRNPETIRRWIRSGRLLSQKVGTQHLVDSAAVDALADEVGLDLPQAWTQTDAGAEMPAWERIVRDGRDSH